MRRINYKIWLQAFPLAIIFTLFILLFINFNNILQLQIQGYSNLGLIRELLSLKLFMTGLIIFLISYMTICYLIKYSYRVGNSIYKQRYLIAGLILLLLIVFKINSSSIGIWVNYLPNSSDSGLLMGINRGVRSDEWALNTPMAISQSLNPKVFFPYFGDIFRGVKTDMFIVYGQPVFDVAVIFRLFNLGYLFFGIERGLSFFWFGRLIALIMVSFEFLQLLTKRNKLLSLSGALLIAFSPLVSWWFAINGLVELLVFGQLAIICIYKYFTVYNYKLRIFLMFIVGICAGSYILVFYPAWQISLLYVFLPLLIGIVILNKDKFKFSAKKDLPIIITVIIIVIFGLGYIFYKSGDTIQMVLNTIYPGQKSSLGGYDWKCLVRYPLSLFYSLKEPNVIINSSEMSNIYSFSPLGVILALWLILKKKKRDPILILLLIFLGILIFYYLVGISKILAGITLLSRAYSRSTLAIGMLNLLILIRSLALMEKINKKAAVILSVSLAILVVSINIFTDYIYFSMLMLPVVLIVLLLSFYAMSRRSFKLLLIPVIFIVFSSLLVNPIRIGLGFIKDNEFLQCISAINNERKIWIIEGVDYPVNNILTLAGVRTLNSTNVYPNLEVWHKVDPARKYEEIYNRYAHIRIDLSNQETSFKLLYVDAMSVSLSVDDLKILEIEYICSKNNIMELNTEQTKFIEKYSYEDYKIYKVEHYEVK